MNIELKKIDQIISRKLAVILTLGYKMLTMCCIIRILLNLFVDLKEVTNSSYEFSVKNLFFLPLEFVMCILVHEMGHYLGAKKYGCLIKNIEINIIYLKGRTNIVNMEKLPCLRKIDIYFSGIMANLELWIILKAMCYIGNIFWCNRCIEMGYMCSALVILNSIPFGDTDGAEIIKMIRKEKNGKFYKNGKR